jgi:hypothetical protein
MLSVEHISSSAKDGPFTTPQLPVPPPAPEPLECAETTPSVPAPLPAKPEAPPSSVSGPAKRTITQPSRFREEDEEEQRVKQPPPPPRPTPPAPLPVTEAAGTAMPRSRKRRYKGGVTSLEDMREKHPALFALLPSAADQLAGFNLTSVFTTEDFKTVLGIRRNLALREMAAALMDRLGIRPAPGSQVYAATTRRPRTKPRTSAKRRTDPLSTWKGKPILTAKIIASEWSELWPTIERRGWLARDVHEGSEKRTVWIPPPGTELVPTKAPSSKSTPKPAALSTEVVPSSVPGSSPAPASAAVQQVLRLELRVDTAVAAADDQPAVAGQAPPAPAPQKSGGELAQGQALQSSPACAPVVIAAARPDETTRVEPVTDAGVSNTKMEASVAAAKGSDSDSDSSSASSGTITPAAIGLRTHAAVRQFLTTEAAAQRRLRALQLAQLKQQRAMQSSAAAAAAAASSSSSSLSSSGPRRRTHSLRLRTGGGSPPALSACSASPRSQVSTPRFRDSPSDVTVLTSNLKLGLQAVLGTPDEDISDAAFIKLHEPLEELEKTGALGRDPNHVRDAHDTDSPAAAAASPTFGTARWTPPLKKLRFVVGHTATQNDMAGAHDSGRHGRAAYDWTVFVRLQEPAPEKAKAPKLIEVTQVTATQEASPGGTQNDTAAGGAAQSTDASSTASAASAPAGTTTQAGQQPAAQPELKLEPSDTEEQPIKQVEFVLQKGSPADTEVCTAPGPFRAHRRGNIDPSVRVKITLDSGRVVELSYQLGTQKRENTRTYEISTKTGRVLPCSKRPASARPVWSAIGPLHPPAETVAAVLGNPGGVKRRAARTEELGGPQKRQSTSTEGGRGSRIGRGRGGRMKRRQRRAPRHCMSIEECLQPASDADVAEPRAKVSKIQLNESDVGAASNRTAAAEGVGVGSVSEDVYRRQYPSAARGGRGARARPQPITVESSSMMGAHEGAAPSSEGSFRCPGCGRNFGKAAWRGNHVKACPRACALMKAEAGPPAAAAVAAAAAAPAGSGKPAQTLHSAAHTFGSPGRGAGRGVSGSSKLPASSPATLSPAQVRARQMPSCIDPPLHGPPATWLALA